MLGNTKRAFCFLIVLVLMPLPFFSISSCSMLDPEPTGVSFSSESNGTANFSFAGGTGVALLGEPSHAGDPLVATVLVSNRGSASGLVTLNLEDRINSISSSGIPVEISPGSSREVSATFVPEHDGTLIYDWWLTSPNSLIDPTLNGEFSVEIAASQVINLSVDSVSWKLDETLSLEISVFLSSGRQRDVAIRVSTQLQGDAAPLQEFPFELNPGRRTLPFDLGNPTTEYIIVEIIPLSWQPRHMSANATGFHVEMPGLELSLFSIEASFSPNSPSSGQSTLVEFELANEDVNHAPSGKVRLIRASDRSILAESLAPSVQPGGKYSSVMEIPTWPDGDRVEIEVMWAGGGYTKSEFTTVDSKPKEDETNLPFDIISATYGVLAGIAAILAGTLAWRSVSTRTPSTSESGFRATRESRKNQSSQEKKEIPCPFCDQRLKLPSNHFGGVKCPACTMQFTVGELPPTPISEETSQPVSSSSDDLLQCPDCNQTLKVSIEKRPVRARCPVCKLEFLAETSEG